VTWVLTRFALCINPTATTAPPARTYRAARRALPVAEFARTIGDSSSSDTGNAIPGIKNCPDFAEIIGRTGPPIETKRPRFLYLCA